MHALTRPQLNPEQLRLRRERRVLAAVLAGLLLTTALVSPVAFADLSMLLLLFVPFVLGLVLTVLVAPLSVSAEAARTERAQNEALRHARETAAAQHAIRTPRRNTLTPDTPAALAAAVAAASPHGIYFGCAHLRDEDFLQAFHACEIRAADFRHGDHLRYTALMLQRVPAGLVHETVAKNLRTFLREVCGSEALFHATRTHAWVTLVQIHLQRIGSTSAARLLQEQAAELRGNALSRFYSSSHLDAPEARRHFVAPDLSALPAAQAPIRSNT